MRLRDTIITVVSLFLTAGLLIAAGLQLDPINKQRQDMKLVMDKPENLPPSLAFATVATGAFRGLLVDFLWIRADRLKQAGQFFDAKQLAEWITILQPRFASVWEFQAWNMAYNISVAIPETQPEQRWRWVKNGYELLRDQAIDRYKLKDIGLYHELARIFQHKIGGISDDDHKYYKLELYSQMDALLRTSDTSPELTGKDSKYFDLLAEAPDSWEGALDDPNIVEFVNALKDTDEKFSDTQNFVGNYLSLRENSSRYNPKAGQVIDKYRGSKTLQKFDIFAKAYRLRKVWKLDPVFMRKVNQMYGPVEWDDPNTHLPMDWRSADTHAIYWAEKGLEVATVASGYFRQDSNDESRDIRPDETNTDRIVVHSLQNLFRMGKMKVFPVDVQVPSDDPLVPAKTVTVKQVFLQPDLRFFRPYNDAILKVIKKYGSKADEGAEKTMRDGHRNMLKNAVLLFYQSGHRQQAQEIYDDLKKQYPLPEFNVSMKEYARNRLLDEIQTLGLPDAREQIIAMLEDSYYCFTIGEDETAAARESDAKDVYDYYNEKYEDVNRLDLPKFDEMKLMAIQAFRTDTQFPAYLRENMFMGRLLTENPEVYKLLMEEDKKKNSTQEQN